MAFSRYNDNFAGARPSPPPGLRHRLGRLLTCLALAVALCAAPVPSVAAATGPAPGGVSAAPENQPAPATRAPLQGDAAPDGAPAAGRGGVPPTDQPAAPPAGQGVLPPGEPAGAPAAESPGDSLGKRMADDINTLGRNAEATHDRLERGILQQVIRLDNFFGKPNNQKEQHSSYLLRWRNSLRLENGGGVNLGSTLRANIDLPRLNDRLKLSIAGEDKPDQFAPSLPEDPGNPGFDRTLRTARVVNTELRYQIFSYPDSSLFAGVGVDLVWPPRVFTRMRYQRNQKLTDRLLLQFAETVFVKSPYGLGETTEIGLERSLDPKTVLRWANSGTVSQEIDALEWGSELSLLHELSPRSAVTLIGGVYGNSSQDDWANNYRILVRYRRNFLRSWLFYELEPQVDWPRRDDGSFATTYAFTVRLEVVFQGEEKPSSGRWP